MFSSEVTQFPRGAADNGLCAHWGKRLRSQENNPSLIKRYFVLVGTGQLSL